MDDNARYLPKFDTSNYKSSFRSSAATNFAIRNITSHDLYKNRYTEVENDDEIEHDIDEPEEDEFKSVYMEDDDEYGSDEEYNPYDQIGKKRKQPNLAKDYEFSSRGNASRSNSGVKSGVRDVEWTQSVTFSLLDAWGDRFLQHGRRSLRSDDWHEVAENLSERIKMGVNDSQCKQRLDTLKKKYKKEKAKFEKVGSSKWVYFKKMDMLMSSPIGSETGLACGVDGGEYVFMDPAVYLNFSNGFDEMRDSPSNSLDDEEENGILQKGDFRNHVDDDSSVLLLADSVHKFGEIYKTIEASKREKMMELEKMRMDFHRELELQRQQMLERVQAEIAKLRQEEGEESDASAENFRYSG